MQIHEITTNKISEGFMDAVKGIGSVAAQGVNQAIGSNFGGAQAGAAVVPGQVQQTALQINTQLAQQQAQQLAANYLKNGELLGTTGVDITALKADLDRILYQQLLPGLKDIKQLPNSVAANQKSAAGQLVQQITTAMKTLLDVRTIRDAKLAEKNWLDITTAAAKAQNLMKFSPAAGARGAAAPVAKDVTITPQGDLLYRGQPYDPRDPTARTAVSQYLLAQKNLIATPKP